MSQDLTPAVFEGLERLCEPQGGSGLPAAPGGSGIFTAPAFPGIERIEAQFSGNMFEPHRHDTYALGVTLHGVQTFTYRGERRFSLPGQVIVLHPDEEHDGGAATEAGLHYRMLYMEPALLMECLEAEKIGLPFVDQPVVADGALAQVLLGALAELDQELDELFVDDFVSRVAGGLSRHSQVRRRALGTVAWKQVCTARDYLEAHALQSVRSGELERITGLDRFTLSRHFRTAFATSPHRYMLMRRLAQAKALMSEGEAFADVAAATGFADQAHFIRHFKKAYGVTPGRWAGLQRLSAGRDGWFAAG